MNVRPAKAPRVSVIVPHFNDLVNLRHCLAALAAQTMPKADFEIIVADNDSPCGLEALEATIAGRAQLVIVGERGAGPARNGGAALARGEILAFTDSDCVPAPDWLAEGVAALADYDFVGGRVDVSVADEGRITPTEAFERVFAFDNQRYILLKGFTVTANLFCTRLIFLRVGPFATEVSEDVEWCRRARECGLILGYAPKAVVLHPARRTWHELRNKWRRLNREMYALAIQEPFGRLRWLAKSLVLPLSAIVHSAQVIRASNIRSTEKIGALAILFSSRFWRSGSAIATMLRNRASLRPTSKDLAP